MGHYQPRRMSSEVAKFVDATKLLKVLKTKADSEELHKALALLGKWAATWQLKFNVK